MRTYRCSSLPLLTTCPAAAVDDGGPRVADNGPEARLGTAVHAVLARWIAEGATFGYFVGEEARRQDTDESKVAYLAYRGWTCWQSLAAWFTPASVEVEMVDGLLTGHADLMHADESGGVLYLGDFKTGYRQPDYGQQLRGYAWLGLQRYPKLNRASVATVWVRDLVADWQHFTRDELEEWYTDLLDTLLKGGERYNPGRHCGYCPRRLTCPAHMAYLRQIVSLAQVTIGFSDLPENSFAYILEAAQKLEHYAAAMREQVKVLVAARGGRVQLDNGRELVLAQQERRTIGYAEAWAVLQEEGLCTAEVRKAITIPREALTRAVMQRSRRGHGSQAVNEMMARLEQAGAVQTKVIEKLEVRKTNNECTTSAGEQRQLGAE